MSKFNDPILDEFEARIAAAATEEEKIEISKEAMQYLTDTGQKIDVESIQNVTDFAIQAVTQVLEAIIRTAREMGEDVVPVQFLKDLQGSVGPLISQKMFEATDLLGVPLDYGVPDDISELLK